MAYDITQVGSVYDSLTTKIKTDLDEQFNLGRIKGSDYANVYAQLIQTCIQLAFQTPTQSAQIDNINKDIEMKNHQEQLIDAQTKNELEDIKVKQEQETLINAQKDNQLEDINLKKEQENLYIKQEALTDAQTQVSIRQKQGFDDNLKQKLFETQMGAWSTMFNSGLLTDKPAIISNDEASALYNSFKTELGIS